MFLKISPALESTCAAGPHACNFTNYTIYITSAPFKIEWLANFWRWATLIGSFEFNINITYNSLRARLHETRSELKPVWNLKPLWNVVPFTWQLHCEQPWNFKPLSKIVPFTWRFHCGNFPNRSKTLLHMCKWYLLINANLIDTKQMLCYWLFFKQ